MYRLLASEIVRMKSSARSEVVTSDVSNKKYQVSIITMSIFTNTLYRRLLRSNLLFRSSLAALIFTTLLQGTEPAHSEPMPPLSDLSGHTLLGATVGSYAIWSVYLSPNGTAKFTYASGGRGEAAWRIADENVICFDFEANGEEVCKRGSAYGIGSGWSTVYLQDDGTWRPFQEDPHGSSRIFGAWPGFIRHNPASFTGDLTNMLPGTVYVDRPGTGIFAVELGPSGAGALLNERGKRELEMVSYGPRQICLQEECVNVQIEDDRLALYKDNSDRLEGFLIYIALGRFTSPLPLAPVKDAQQSQEIANVGVSNAEAKLDIYDTAEPTGKAMDEALASEACTDGALFYGTSDCKAAMERAVSQDTGRIVSSATGPTNAENESQPVLDLPEVEYLWFGRSADLQVQKLGTRDKRGQTRVDFENGSPRIGGRILIPSFVPDSARIVAVSEALALIRFSGSLLPKGCVEAYRWLWVQASDHGVLSEPFGACTAAEDVEVHYEGSRIVTTITPEEGIPSTFEIFPYRSDDIDPLRVSVTSGPSVDFEPVSEEDWKTIERRAAEAQRIATAEAAKEEAQIREADMQAEKEAALARRRQPATPTWKLDDGNVFDILAQDSVQSAIAASDDAKIIQKALSDRFYETVYLPHNKHVGDIYVGLSCGPSRCAELMAGAIYNRVTQDAFGFVQIDFETYRFGSEGWLMADPSAQVVTDTLSKMVKAIPAE